MKSRLILLPLLFALGCSKSDDPTSAASCLVSKIEYTSYLSGKVYTTGTLPFVYDGSNKLIKIDGFYAIEYVWESGQVKSVKLLGNKIEDWTYTNGKLSKIDGSGGGGNPVGDVVLNSEGQPTKIGGRVYTYDANGNVLTEGGSGGLQFSNYDTSPNFGKLLAASLNLSFFPAPYQFPFRSGALLGKNNHRVRSEATGSPRSLAYTYNAKGQVATITESTSAQDYTVYTISYSNCN